MNVDVASTRHVLQAASVFATLTALALTADGIAAQRLADVDAQSTYADRRSTYAVPPQFIQPRIPDDDDTGPMVVGGTLGAIIGFAGGAALGYHLERRYWQCNCDDPGIGGLLIGSAAGSTLAVPTAVHLVNDRRGSYPRVLGASALVGAAGAFGLITTISSEAGLLFLFGTPAAQVIVATLVERSTAK
jgi:hypothetical protein